jgi:hypothetical protein
MNILRGKDGVPLDETWNSQGYLILKDYIDEDAIEKYKKLWIEQNSDGYDDSGNLLVKNRQGFLGTKPYLQYSEILDIMCSDKIASTIDQLFDDVYGLHLNFTSWYTTRRAWHHDVQFPTVNNIVDYFGIWVALDDIELDSGPFQFVPGSHKWDVDFDFIYAEPESGKPSKIIEQYISERKANVLSFMAKKGDIIIWDGRLLHRGSEARNPEMLRKCLIGHYTNTGGKDNYGKHGLGYYFNH